MSSIDSRTAVIVSRKVLGRVFLDTCAVNFIFDFGEQIHEGAPPPQSISPQQREDIDAFFNIFLAGSRCSLEFAISDRTYEEILQTRDLSRKGNLERWFFELWAHFETAVKAEVRSLNKLIPGGWDFSLPNPADLAALPDPSDRALINTAICYRCELFCTRDWRTILRHRVSLPNLPIKIVSPKELWNHLRQQAVN